MPGARQRIDSKHPCGCHGCVRTPRVGYFAALGCHVQVACRLLSVTLTYTICCMYLYTGWHASHTHSHSSRCPDWRLWEIKVRLMALLLSYSVCTFMYFEPLPVPVKLNINATANDRRSSSAPVHKTSSIKKWFSQFSNCPEQIPDLSPIQQREHEPGLISEHQCWTSVSESLQPGSTSGGKESGGW